MRPVVVVLQMVRGVAGEVPVLGNRPFLGLWIDPAR